MRLSKQIYISKVSDTWNGIYAPFNHNIAFLEDSDLNLLKNKDFQSLEPSLLEFLKDNNIVVEDGFEEKWLKENLSPVSINFDSLYLITTTKCNLACKYCVVLGNKTCEEENLEEKMSIEVGMAALKVFKDQLLKNNSKHARVTFYGGEPLLNQKLIIALLPEIDNMRKEVKRPIDIVVISNGYIFNQELAELFKKYNVDVAISIDGTEKHHDLARVNNNQEGTYQEVIKNFKNYKDTGMNVNITTTIGKHNVHDLPQIAEFFAKELGVKMAEFQVPCDTPGNGNPFWVSMAEITKYLMEAYEVLDSYKAIECTTYRRMNNFSKGIMRLRDCGASGSQLVVAPDGSMGPCHSLVGSRTYFKGNVMVPNSDPSQMGNFTEWANRYPINMPICQKCPFISLCGGGCIYNAYLQTGSIWAKDLQSCSYMKEMVDWLLQKFWDQIQDEKAS